jgi:hypothetical protein
MKTAYRRPWIIVLKEASADRQDDSVGKRSSAAVSMRSKWLKQLPGIRSDTRRPLFFPSWIIIENRKISFERPIRNVS